MKKLSKLLFVIILTVITLIVLKGNTRFRELFYKYVYDTNISFAQINNWYQSKFGSPIPFDEYINDTESVFEETLKYSEASIYKDGVKLTVDYNYLVPALDSGIVIFVGEKEGYGNTVIIEQENGVDVWYSGLSEINLSLYDYIKEGSLIGEANETLYLVFIKDGEVVDYKEYI